MLWKIEIPYTANQKEFWEALDWDKVKELWPLATDQKPENYWSFDRGPCRLEEYEVHGLMALGFTAEAVPYPGAMITKMQDRAKWEYSIPITPEALSNASAVHIAIPDFCLLQIQTVTVIEDACTDALQSYLDDGWRILAVCPPNAARRPDYILGHKDKDKDRGR